MPSVLMHSYAAQRPPSSLFFARSSALEKFFNRLGLGEGGEIARDGRIESHLADVEESVQQGGVEVGQRDRIASWGIILGRRLANDLPPCEAAAAECKSREAGVM